MPVNTNTPPLIPYSFNDLQTNLLAYLKTFPEWTNVNAQDSIVQMLVNVLAYYTSFILGNVNQVFIDYFPHLTASDKLLYDFGNFLGLAINGTVSGTGSVTFSIPAPSAKQVELPVGTEVSNGGSIIYSTSESGTINIGDTSTTISVSQGQYSSTSFTGTGLTWQKFYMNVLADTSSVTVTVNGTTWSKVTSFLFSTNTSQQYMVKQISNGWYILFGDSITGAMPANGDTIVVTYLESLGTAGEVQAGEINTINSQIYYSDVSIVSNITVTNPSEIANASDGDTTTTLRQNEQAWLTANPYLSRKEDYIAYVNAYPTVFDSVAYAGWEIYTGQPMTYSTLYLFLVKQNKSLFSGSELIDIKNYIKQKDIFVTNVELNNVSYVGVNPSLTVTVLKNTTQAQINVLRTQIADVLNAQFDFVVIQSEGDTVFREVYNSVITDAIQQLDYVKNVYLTLEAVETIATILATTGSPSYTYTYTKTIAYSDINSPTLYVGNTLIGTFGTTDTINYLLDQTHGTYNPAVSDFTYQTITASLVGTALSINISNTDIAPAVPPSFDWIKYVGQLFNLCNEANAEGNLQKTNPICLFELYAQPTPTINISQK